MNIYNIHPQTGEYLNTGIADESPLEPGEYLIPAYATAIAPPSVLANQKAVFDGDAWSVLADFRGLVFYLADGSKHIITELGVSPPVGSTPTPPPAPAPSIEEVRAAMVCSSWQMRRAMTQTALRADVESAIAAADQDTKDMWEYATTFQRTHPIVAALAASMNKTDAEIDALFALALSITE